MSSIDQQFIEYIVKSIVGNPDAVKIERRIDEKGVLLELTVDGEDLGRVIGKRGATAQSLRTLLRALGTKNDARYNLKIVDTGMPPPPRDRAQTSDDNAADTAASDDSKRQDDVAVDESAADDNVAPQKDDIDDLQDVEDALVRTSPSERHSDVVSKTRAELAELDDLDV